MHAKSSQININTYDFYILFNQNNNLLDTR